MKISLNELVSMLSDRVGMPFNVPLQEELKVIFNYKRADWFQKIIDKHPEQRRFFKRYITDDLVDVDRAECPGTPTGCTVRRSSKPIPTPVRSTFTLFDYVGDTDKVDGYTYVEPDQLIWIFKYGSTYTKDRPKYAYYNKYVYIYNDDVLEQITIGGMWSDPRELSPFKCDDVPCYTDDDQWDIPGDIINTMVQDILKNELRLLLAGEPDEVTVDKKEQNGGN